MNFIKKIKLRKSLIALSLSVAICCSCAKNTDGPIENLPADGVIDSTEISIGIETVLIIPGPELDTYKASFLEKVNKLRATGCQCGATYMPPTTPLKWNNILYSAAQKYAQEMALTDWFSHTAADGRSMTQRMLNEGYSIKGYQYKNTGENIARGQITIEGVMDSWIKSPGHCRNIMSGKFREIGVGHFKNAKASGYKDYWVMDLGALVPFGGFKD